MKSVKVPSFSLGQDLCGVFPLFVQKQKLDFPCPLLLSKVGTKKETLGVNSFFPSLTSNVLSRKSCLLSGNSETREADKVKRENEQAKDSVNGWK